MHPDVLPSHTQARALVWAPWRFNLGDHWQTINYLITRSFVLREEQLLSRYQHGQDFGPRFAEILSLINGPERSCVTIVDEPGTQEPDGFDVWAAPSWPTNKRWDASRVINTVTYQFDGISSAESKNPPLADQVRMLHEAQLRKVLSARLGSHMTLTECVAALARSRLFLGCDSGMSHLAHAVGVPTIVVEYALPVITCHRNKHFILAKGTAEALQAIRQILAV